MSKHTPGPWEASGNSVFALMPNPDKESVRRGMPSEFNRMSVTVFCHQRNTEEEIANAKLIASAPELLEAMKAILGLTDDKNILSIVREAIAKAEGR